MYLINFYFVINIRRKIWERFSKAKLDTDKEREDDDDDALVSGKWKMVKIKPLSQFFFRSIFFSIKNKVSLPDQI